MFGPSPNVLIQTCTLYSLVPTQDADGGLDASASYSTVIASNVPCSAQNYATSTEEDVDGRVSVYNRWLVFLNADYGLKADDKIVLNTGEEIYVGNATDAAGRGASWQVDGTQRK